MKTNISNNHIVEGRLEGDSHADTCTPGKTCVVFEETGDMCAVYLYSDAHEPRTVKNVNAFTACTCPKSREVFICMCLTRIQACCA